MFLEYENDLNDPLAVHEKESAPKSANFEALEGLFRNLVFTRES